MKRCQRCGTVKPLDQFGRWRRYGGSSPDCKRCLANAAATRYRQRREAAGHVYKRDPVDRFLSRVDTSGGCWLWTGPVDGGGYGLLTFQGVPISAHRVSYLLHNGDLPTGSLICHHCDNPPCVNPDHLYAGDFHTNARDAVARNRYVPRPGEENPAALLTTERVTEIRRRWQAGEPQARLAREFGISTSQTHRIVHGESWRHVA